MKRSVSELREQLLQRLREGRTYQIPAAPAALAVAVIYAFILLQHVDGFAVTSLLLLAGIAALWGLRRTGAALFLALLGVVTAVERHFITHYGDSFRDCGTQALITLNITDADEVLSYIALLKIGEYFTVLLFAAAIVMQFRVRPPAGRRTGAARRCAGAAAFLAVALFVWLIANAPVRDFFRDWQSQKEFFLKRQSFAFHAVDRAPEAKAVHFLVIGESHRKDEFDSIVLHGGSPVLTRARREGTLFEFDDVISYYQQTWFSVFTLLSRRGAGDMSIFFPEKGLLALFREAGWQVYYVTYQPKNLSVTGYDCVVNEAGVYVDARELTGCKMDSALLEAVDGILEKRESKVLIVIKMVGCHFQYKDRYPQEPRYCRNLPAYNDDNFRRCRVEDKAMLVNTYRNAMLFSAEVLDGLAQRCSSLAVPSFFFFLSDHGIINYDDGKNPFFGAARSNFHIPCCVYFNGPYRKTMAPALAENLRRNRTLPAGNDYVFETLLTLSGIDYPGARHGLDLAAPDAKPALDRKVWVWKTQMNYDLLKY